MPDRLKIVIVELTAVAVIFGGCVSLLTARPLGLVAVLVGHRLLWRPGEINDRLDHVVELLASRKKPP